MEFTRVIRDDKKSPMNNDPNTIKYMGIPDSVYPAMVRGTAAVFCVPNKALIIPNKTSRMRVDK